MHQQRNERTSHRAAEAIIMETATLGKVITHATIENLMEAYEAERGQRRRDNVRRVQVEDALVDTGATMLSLPASLIKQLGLRKVRTRSARTAGGQRQFDVYEAVQLSVQGRQCVCEVAELDDSCPVLIGQIPLEMLDWVVDPVNQRLIGNPEHGGEQMIELYSVFE
jgi:clan AA aspartic protease